MGISGKSSISRPPNKISISYTLSRDIFLHFLTFSEDHTKSYDSPYTFLYLSIQFEHHLIYVVCINFLYHSIYKPSVYNVFINILYFQVRNKLANIIQKTPLIENADNIMFTTINIENKVASYRHR